MLTTPEVPYVPAAHLISGPLTDSQVIAFFKDFSSTLRYVSTAPELVFERVVGNLCDAFKVVIENERQEHSRDRDLYHSRNQKLEAELAELRLNVLKQDDQSQSETVCLDSPSNPQDNLNHQAPASSTVAEIPQRSNPLIGTFMTDEIRYWFQLYAQTSKMVTFGRPYHAPPGLPIGLNSVQMSNLTNVRIKSYTSDIRDDRFEIHLDSWDNTLLFNAGCTWLEIEDDDPDFQFGSYSTLENQLAQESQKQNSRQIAFSRPYDLPPCVVVWLSGFEMRSQKYWRVKCYATDITETGFTIHLDTWDDTVLCSGTATWVAYTAGKPGVCSGSFNTGISGPQRSHTENEEFEKGVFATCPRVIVALNMMDISCFQFLRVRVRVSEVSVERMRWHLEGWVDTYIKAAGASYIAMRWA